MTEQGVPKRHNTLIDIPDSLRLPHFMVVDDVNSEQSSSGLSQEYKLVLQSVVCHRGDSLHSGHYVAFARVAPKLLTDNRRHDHDPPPDYEEAQWAKFDDLAVEKRVTYVDDIRQSLREEMPYLLFYQIVPMVDVTAASTDGSVTEPPSYLETATTVPGTPSVETAVEPSNAISRSASGYFDSTTTLPAGAPDIRLSSEVEGPVRLSFDDGSDAAVQQPDPGNSRRASISFSEPAAHPSGVSTETTSPVMTPQDESTGTRLSRAAARFTKSSSKSRATSQASDGRMSFSIPRLGFQRTSKELPNGGTGANRLSSEGGADEQGALSEADEAANSEDKGKDHHHHYHRRERNKSKSREKEEKKAKEKGKGSKDTAADKEAVPDRECVVM
jgi:hypothetical protein